MPQAGTAHDIEHSESIEIEIFILEVLSVMSGDIEDYETEKNLVKKTMHFWKWNN